MPRWKVGPFSLLGLMVLNVLKLGGVRVHLID